MSLIDVYFLSNSYPVYLLWIQTTRTRLMGLNQYTPSNSATEQEKERVKNYLKTVSKAGDYLDNLKYEKSFSDSDIAKKQKQTGIITDGVSTYSTQTAEKAKAAFLASVKKIKAEFLQKKIKAEKLIVDEIAKRSGKRVESLGNEGNPIPVADRVNSDINSTPTYLDYDYIKSQTFGTDPTFPQTGTDVTKAITDEILNKGRFAYSFFSGGKEETEYRGWVKFPGLPAGLTNADALKKLNSIKKGEADKTKFIGTPTHEMSEYSKEVLNNTKIISPTGTYKFFIEKLHGRYYSNGAAQPYKLNPIDDKQAKIYDAKGNNFSNRRVFAAFIDNYNDSYTVNWSDYDFIGRGEKSYVYKNTERKITLEFTIITDHTIEQLAALDQLNEKIKSGNENDILSFLLNEDTIHWGKGTYNHDHKQRLAGGVSTYYDTPETSWQKLTFLAQCCYPYYRTDGKMKEQPLVRIRIADFYDVICMIGSLNIKLDPFDVPYIDFNVSALGEQPMGFKVTLDATIVHDYEPSSQFYGFYHRKQFDVPDSDAAYKAKVWGIGLSKNADTLTKVLNKRSPLSIKDVFNGQNLKDLLTTTDFQEIQNDIKVFKENFKDLGNKSINLFDQVRKVKLKNIFDAIKNIRNQKDVFDALATVYDKLDETKGFIQSGVGSLQKEYDSSLSQVNSFKDKVASTSKEVTDKLENVKIEAEKNIDIAANFKNLATNNAPKTIGEMLEKSSKNTNNIG